MAAELLPSSDRAAFSKRVDELFRNGRISRTAALQRKRKVDESQPDEDHSLKRRIADLQEIRRAAVERMAKCVPVAVCVGA